MGGWDKIFTQSTVIHPSTVKQALTKMEVFVQGFNVYLSQQGLPAVQLGHPTGSSAYYLVDSENTVYGDIDLQLVVPELEETKNKTTSQAQGFWYNLEDSFVRSGQLSFVHPASEPGHPIVDLGNDQWVQVDLMPHPTSLATWGRYRTTPEQGMKGLLNGNMFSVLGELLTLSIQHSGVQYKERSGKKVSYVKTRKDYKLVTITTDIEHFVKHIFEHQAQWQGITDPVIDPMLEQYPGSKLDKIKISNLVNAVKGLAYSFEGNDMFSKGDLEPYDNAGDFIYHFKQLYSEKANNDINSSKRDKATTEEAKRRAEQDRTKVKDGLNKVLEMFDESV